MRRREHETDAHTLDAARDLLRLEPQVDASGFQQIGAATLAGHGAVAVLGHLATGRGDDEGRGGGDVEDVHAIATGAAGVDQPLGVDHHRCSQLAHDAGGTDDLVDGLALHAHAHEEGADLRVGALTGHDLAHHRLHFLGGQIELGDDAAQGFLDIHARTPPVCLRKLANSSWPCSVRMDSG